jgi:ferredoxin
MRTEISADKVNGDFLAQVERLSGQSIWACYQCGCCSSGCPVAEEMDLLPNQVIRYVQLGLEEELLSSKTIWLCASCFQCFARCPRHLQDHGCVATDGHGGGGRSIWSSGNFPIGIGRSPSAGIGHRGSKIKCLMLRCHRLIDRRKR